MRVTCCDPDTGNAFAEMEGVIVKEVALVVAQVSVTLWPEATLVAFAVNVREGAAGWVG